MLYSNQLLDCCKARTDYCNVRAHTIVDQPWLSQSVSDADNVKKRLKLCIALHGKPISELPDVTCHMGSHSVTCHPTQVSTPRLNPSQLAGTRFTYPGGMEGWVDLGYPAMHRPGVELAISRSQVRRPNHYTTEPPKSHFKGWDTHHGASALVWFSCNRLTHSYGDTSSTLADTQR